MTAKPQDGWRGVCLHGHFYQPPRENPWLNAVPREPSADPDHDWNRRITNECYRPNAAARIMDHENRILALRNNYEWLSFDFGPTLMAWLERQDPWVMQRLLEADRRSAKRLGGWGNALAQAYHHIILPLANRRDKETQIAWGIAEFRHRYGRNPDGLWLPETAVDHETLAVLADAGIRFTILAPHQAARWRFMEGESTVWRDVRDGSIPYGRAYRYRCTNGKWLYLFFYNDKIARGIAFERLLEHSSWLLAALRGAFADSQALPGEPWLVHAATDGESYGHHFKFGDMALAAAFDVLEKDSTTEVVNYAAFLDRFPVRAEVEIVSETAWSCAHGVGRWRMDCGCHSGAHPDWHQKWREPLREALDTVRDALALHFEKEAATKLRDPWAARNDYIHILLKGAAEKESFFQRHQIKPLEPEDRRQVLELMEMQREAMAMYTSCGWFFDDVSGVETQIILAHACRAMELARLTGASPLEDIFLKVLEKAPSNLPEIGHGANVYNRLVVPKRVSPGIVCAGAAMEALALKRPSRKRLHVFVFRPLLERFLCEYPMPCQVGIMDVEDERTERTTRCAYAAVLLGGLDVRVSVKPVKDETAFDPLVQNLQSSAVEGVASLLRCVDEMPEAEAYSLKDVPEDVRMGIAYKLAEDHLDFYTEFQKRFFNAHQSLLWSLREWGIPLPADIKDSVRRIVERQILDVLEPVLTEEDTSEAHFRENGAEGTFRRQTFLGRLEFLHRSLASWGVPQDLPEVHRALTKAVRTELRRILKARGIALEKLCLLVDIAQALRMGFKDWWIPTLWWDLSRGLHQEHLGADQRSCLRTLDALSSCTFLS
ncbi:DUF3536 domain-containing protein [Desulfosoma caldarium]|uniref:Glycosyl hydrolase family 57 n=1 Tax=Desulfosoma caldarium TaxID=610254 RepID=A0A3N1VFE6_9BACT|nr:DUF3536 domain-containing protein [Desulfosoma caldarium]ROR01615.1 glycosyl hydrolase family 57 [Desulfosoma caldarium]